MPAVAGRRFGAETGLSLNAYNKNRSFGGGFFSIDLVCCGAAQIFQANARMFF